MPKSKGRSKNWGSKGKGREKSYVTSSIPSESDQEKIGSEGTTSAAAKITAPFDPLPHVQFAAPHFTTTNLSPTTSFLNTASQQEPQVERFLCPTPCLDPIERDIYCHRKPNVKPTVKSATSKPQRQLTDKVEEVRKVKAYCM